MGWDYVSRGSVSRLWTCCGEGELVGGVHTLVWRSVQVYHELQELEEEDKGREEVQETERENQGEEKRSHEYDHVDEVKD